MSRTNLTNYTISGTLGVTGATTLVGAVTMGSTLGVTGATTLHSTLGVTGASTLVGAVAIGSTLGVTGATTLHSTLGVTGASNLIGAVYVGSTLAVTGATTLHGTLGVTGASTLVGNVGMAGTLGVTGATTLHSTLGVTGAVSFSNNLRIQSTNFAQTDPAIDIGQAGTISTSSTNLRIASNSYNDGALKHKVTGAAANFILEMGVFRWYTAASASAGVAQTLTQRMWMDVDGYLTINRTTAQTTAKLWTRGIIAAEGDPGEGLFAGYSYQSGAAITVDTSMLGIVGYGWDGAASAVGAAINFRASETWVTGGAPERGTYIQFRTVASNGSSLTEKMRLSDTGFLGIGATSPDGPLHIASSSLLAAGSASVVLSGENNTERLAIRSASASVFHLGYYGGTYAAKTVVTGGTYPGYIQFGGWDGASWHRGAWITAYADENYSTTRRGTSLIFSTALAGADSAMSERVRVMHSGQVLINRTTNTVNAEHLNVEGAIRAKIPTAGLPHASDSETDAAVGLRIHTGASWVLDFGSNNGPGWVQARHATNAVGADLLINPRGGPVIINATTTGNGQLFGVYSATHYGVPPNSGTSTTTTAMRLHMGGVAYDFGVNGTGASWIQVHGQANQAINYPLCLNPNGGGVGIGQLTAATYPLEVTGSVYASSSLIAASSVFSNGGWYYFNSGATAYIQFNGSSRFTFSHALETLTVQGAITSYTQGTFNGDWPVITTIGGAGALQLYNTGAADADQFAGVTFHNAGAYAVNFGLVASELRVGGWSLGAVSYRIVHEGLTNWAIGNATIPSTASYSHFILPGTSMIAARGFLTLSANVYYNAGYKCITTASASMIYMADIIDFYYDASGTSGSAFASNWGYSFARDYMCIVTVGSTTESSGHLTMISESTSKYGVHLMGYGSVTSNLFMGTTHAGTRASPTASVAGRQFAIMARTWDGTSYANTAAIQLEANATCASNDHPTNITFATTPDGSASRSERMRLDFNGYLLVGYAASNGAYNLQVNSQIYATNATIATSDARYKERVTSITDGLSVIKELNPVSFFWKEHPVHKFEKEECVGFLAQEVESVFRSKNKAAVRSIIKKNMIRTNPHIQDKSTEVETPDESTPIMEEFLGMSDTALIPFLVSAVKELSEEVDRLKSHK